MDKTTVLWFLKSKMCYVEQLKVHVRIKRYFNINKNLMTNKNNTYLFLKRIAIIF